MTLLTLATSVASTPRRNTGKDTASKSRALCTCGTGGKAADSRGEFFGCAAGIGGGASAWDFQPKNIASAAGPSHSRTSQKVRLESAKEGKADINQVPGRDFMSTAPNWSADSCATVCIPAGGRAVGY